MIIKALIQQFIHGLTGMFTGHRRVVSTTTYSIFGIPIWTKYRLIACVCGKVFYKKYRRKRKVRINPAIPKSMLNKVRKVFKENKEK